MFKSKLALSMTILFATTAISAPSEISPQQLHKQMPAFEVSGLGDEKSTALLDGVLPGDFESLQTVIAAFARAPTSMRGPQEIAIYRRAAPAVVLLKTKEASGSGVILESGAILTNRHVVEGVGEVEIFFKPETLSQTTEGAEFRTGQIKFVDPHRDLALIQPSTLPKSFSSLKIATQDNLEIGADVYAIGHPLGYSWTFTEGVVSGIRSIKDDDQDYTAIQTQTPINPGNSGGPLLNANIEVVGLNTWVRDISEIKKVDLDGKSVPIARPAQGLNFAVSAKDVRAFLADISNGKITNLPLQVPQGTAGCKWQTVFSGRTKEDDSGLKAFSSRCDGVADCWEIFPDDKSKQTELHLDMERTGRSTIVILSDPSSGKWQTSYWDLFRDQTFAVIGHHETGTIKPTSFEFARS